MPPQVNFFMDSGRTPMRPAIQFSCRVTVLMLAVLWLYQTPLWAGIYKWKDDQGKIHFTDDKSRIPLKYRERFEKFKGVVEPKPKSVQQEPVVEPVEAEKEKEVVASSEPVMTEEEKTAELVAALEETKTFLEYENVSHERLIKFVKPNKFNGKNYINEVRRRLTRKKMLSEKLSEFKAPVLIEANSYLTKSAALDESEDYGGEDFEERILALQKRMKTQIVTKRQIIKQIKAQLKETAG